MPNPFNNFNKKPKLFKDVKNPTYIQVDVILGHKIDESSGEVAVFPRLNILAEPVSAVVARSKDECGLKNVLKKFMKTGDLGLFNQRPVLTNIDVTNLPDRSPEEIYKDLPKELTGDKTYEEFLNSLTVEQLEAFYKSKLIKENTNEVKGDAQ